MVERNPRVNGRIDGDSGASACMSARAPAFAIVRKVVARDLLSFDLSASVQASRARLTSPSPGNRLSLVRVC